MEMNNEKLLIIFVKNPVLGKVKKRLAETLGEEKALVFYQFLLKHTLDVTSRVDGDKVVYYSEYVPAEDEWKKRAIQQRVQRGFDTRHKMQNAFSDAFKNNYERVVIMGSDCYNLDTGMINEAFEALKQKDVVIGPATNGGYYLLGMKKLHGEFFRNHTGNTSTILPDIIADLESNDISYELLPALTNIPEEKDIATLKHSSRTAVVS